MRHSLLGEDEVAIVTFICLGKFGLKKVGIISKSMFQMNILLP